MQTNYNRAQADALMIVEIICIVVMLGLLVYWHVKNPDSLNVTLSIEKELLANDAAEERAQERAEH